LQKRILSVQPAKPFSVEWKVAPGLVPYAEAVAFMEARVQQIAAGEAAPLIWLVEHPPLYTAGVSAKAADLLDGERFPVFPTNRGGQYTYHGPGQRIVYAMLDLKQLAGEGAPDLRVFIRTLENWVIATLAQFGVQAERREGRVGLWVTPVPPLLLGEGGGEGSAVAEGGAENERDSTAVPALIPSFSQGEKGSLDFLPLLKSALPMREAKIAAIGIRVHKWISYHGISINLNPNLEHFAGIVPCGIREHDVTSLWALGKTITLEELDKALAASFESVFGNGKTQSGTVKE
jgi:lipoyl(octanoyl) transferase